MKKYLKMENSYRNKHIEHFLGVFPEIADCEYVLQEKIDGTNLRVHITKDNIMFGSSGQEFTLEQAKHFNLRGFIEENPVFMDKFKLIQRYIGDRDDSYTLYGEYFGRGIEKRIPYWKEKEKDIKFFDIAFNDELLPPAVFEDMMKSYGMESMMVPVICYVKGLKAALDHPTVFKSKLADAEAEGCVIKPYRTIFDDNDSIFYIKHKNQKFLDGSLKVPENDRSSNDDVPNPFLEYISENRVLDMISKEGPLESKRDIGKYINLVIQDAVEDWMKDHEDRPDTKSAGKIIAHHLMKHMP